MMSIGFITFNSSLVPFYVAQVHVNLSSRVLEGIKLTTSGWTDWPTEPRLHARSRKWEWGWIIVCSIMGGVLGVRRSVRKWFHSMRGTQHTEGQKGNCARAVSMVSTPSGSKRSSEKSCRECGNLDNTSAGDSHSNKKQKLSTFRVTVLFPCFNCCPYTCMSPIMRHRHAKRTIGWLCPFPSKCQEVRGQPQRDWGRTLGTMCTCASGR